jgi:hypothetical protein
LIFQRSHQPSNSTMHVLMSFAVHDVKKRETKYSVV